MAGIRWETHGKPGSQIYLLRLGLVATAKMQRPQSMDCELIKKLRRDNRTIGFYYEPGLATKAIGQLGKSRATEPLAHSATSLIDLGVKKEQLLASFSAKTRYNIGYTLKKKAIITTTTSLNKLSERERADFYSLRVQWNLHKGLHGYEFNFLESILRSYRDHGQLHIAYHKNTPIAALLILTNDHVAAYYTAYSTPLGNQHFAPTLLTWTSMEMAKQAGCDIYDFGGVYDRRYPKLYKRWQGFSKFKEGFRPTFVQYPPSRLQLFW